MNKKSTIDEMAESTNKLADIIVDMAINRSGKRIDEPRKSVLISYARSKVSGTILATCEDMVKKLETFVE